MTRAEEITNAALEECAEQILDCKWAFMHGAVWADEHPKNLWKDAQGDDLPELEREVIVLIQYFTEDTDILKVCFAHRPNPDGWDGKSALTGKVEHYVPKTYDKGGWNIPDVKYWLDLELPYNSKSELKTELICGLY